MCEWPFSAVITAMCTLVNWTDLNLDRVRTFTGSIRFHAVKFTAVQFSSEIRSDVNAPLRYLVDNILHIGVDLTQT